LPRPTLARAQGAWVAVADKGDGLSTPTSGLRVVFTRDRMAFFLGNAPADAWTVTLDPAGAPGTLDMRRIGPGEPSLLRGRYVLEGNTLTIAFLTTGDRPPDLSGRVGRLITFRR
jgi:uncharacterized protein (TIGR03067 family)